MLFSTNLLLTYMHKINYVLKRPQAVTIIKIWRVFTHTNMCILAAMWQPSSVYTELANQFIPPKIAAVQQFKWAGTCAHPLPGHVYTQFRGWG